MITSTTEILIILAQICLNVYGAKCVYPYEDRFSVFLFHINGICIAYNLFKIIDIIT